MPDPIDPVLQDRLYGLGIEGSISDGAVISIGSSMYGDSLIGSVSDAYVLGPTQQKIYGDGVVGAVSDASIIGTPTWFYLSVYGESVNGLLADGYAARSIDLNFFRAYYPESDYQPAGNYVSSVSASGSSESEYQA
jgi:hypothetical protein